MQTLLTMRTNVKDPTSEQGETPGRDAKICIGVLSIVLGYPHSTAGIIDIIIKFIYWSTENSQLRWPRANHGLVCMTAIFE